MLKTIFLLAFLFTTTVFSAEYTAEELDKLYQMKYISDEDYKMFMGELKGELFGEAFYDLRVNGIPLSLVYPVKREGKNLYFPIIKFLNLLNFKNYQVRNGVLELYLGTDLEKIVIDDNSKTVTGGYRNPKKTFTESEIKVEESDFWIESELFKTLFLKGVEIDNDKYRISMGLSFQTPQEIKSYLNVMAEKLSEEENILTYSNKNRLWDTGYMNVDFQVGMKKEREGKFEKDWSGNLEYQGEALYGQLTTSYNLKNEELGNISFYYPKIWNNQTLEVGSYTSGNNRELGFKFEKELGYYREGRNFVIRERVPTGSKVELLYMGYPIMIQDAVDGVVEFEGNEIYESRKYTLRVYTPDGKIDLIEIETSPNFKQQSKGGVEYELAVREVYSSNKYRINSSVYYGITESFTGGIGYSKEIKESNESFQDWDKISLDGVYGGTVYRFPYNLSLNGDKYVNSPLENSDEKESYSYGMTGDITMKWLRLSLNEKKYGRYYEAKSDSSYKININPNLPFNFTYTKNRKKYYDSERGDDSSLGINYSQSFRNMLFLGNYSKSSQNNENYEVNLYYTGLDKFNVQLSTKWENSFENYETRVALNNKNIFDLFDYTFEYSYSQSSRERYSLKFNFYYESWLKGESNYSKGGRQNYLLGVKRTVDLKDVTRTVESMDTSRVKVITFIDSNGNNIYDEGEPFLDSVGVRLGKEEVVTDKNGIAWFSGVPNNIAYDMKVAIRKPSYSMGKNSIQVKGTKSGTIEVYIPIKPMLNMRGEVLISDQMDKEKTTILENIVIRVRDSGGKIVETINPESDGFFEISGLFTETYTVEIVYIGKDYQIAPFTEELALTHNEKRKSQYKIEVYPTHFKLSKLDF